MLNEQPMLRYFAENAIRFCLQEMPDFVILAPQQDVHLSDTRLLMGRFFSTISKKVVNMWSSLLYGPRNKPLTWRTIKWCTSFNFVMVKEIKRVENYFLKVTGEATHCQPNHWFLPELIDLLLAGNCQRRMTHSTLFNKPCKKGLTACKMDCFSSSGSKIIEGNQ